MTVRDKRRILASLFTIAILTSGALAFASPANAAHAPAPVDPVAAVSATGGLGLQQAVAATTARNQAAAGSTSQFQALTITPSDATATAVTHSTLNGLPTTTLTGSNSHSYVVGTSPAGTPAAFAVITNSTSPASFNFNISSSTGGTTLDAPRDGVITVRDATGKAVNFIDPAWAVDATGKSLPTSYTVQGSTVTQHVDLTGAVFPVVADPTLACDLWFCTLEFNKADTKNAADYEADAAGLVVVGCTIVDPILGGICAVAGTSVHIEAVAAENSHSCLGIRYFKLGGPPYPVTYTGSACK